MCQSANPFCSPPGPTLSSFGNALPYNPLSVAAVDRLMGRTTPRLPPHLARALFIPRHTSSLTHMPLYDMSQAYWARMRDHTFGSHAYKVDMMFLQRPQGDGDADVCFFADVDEQRRTLTVEPRSAAAEKSAALTLTLPTAPLGDSTILIPGVGSYRVYAHMDTPLQGGGRNGKAAATNSYRPCPRLTVEPDGDRGTRWEVRPEDAGSLCYSVQATNREGAEPEVKAMYHHAGSHLEHPRDFSEGVLLLSTEENMRDDLTAIALIGLLLWHIRSLADEKKSPGLKLLRKFSSRISSGGGCC